MRHGAEGILEEMNLASQGIINENLSRARGRHL